MKGAVDGTLIDVPEMEDVVPSAGDKAVACGEEEHTGHTACVSA
jgi:hypothetical protein